MKIMNYNQRQPFFIGSTNINDSFIHTAQLTCYCSLLIKTDFLQEAIKHGI